MSPSPGESVRARRPLIASEPVDDEDIVAAREETASQAYRRGVVETLGKPAKSSPSESSEGGGGRWGRAGRVIGGVLVVALGSGGVGAGVATKMQPGPADLKCSNSTVLLVLHLDAAGRDLAAAQEAAGQPDVADRTRRLTDVRNLPEDIQLCVLLSKQRPGVEP